MSELEQAQDSQRQGRASLFQFHLWMPQFVYPTFKRVMYRWCYSATFHGRWVRVILR